MTLVTVPVLAVVTPLSDGLPSTLVIIGVRRRGVVRRHLDRPPVRRRVRRQCDAEGTIAADERAKRIDTVWTMLRNVFTARS